MKIGIPGGLLYYKYEPFIRTFFNEMEVDAEYSVKSNKEILDLGIKNCVDEACLPMKLFHGHTVKLQNTCDFTVAPRLMSCEFGESICPKFHGLPELISAGTGKSNQLFTEPIYLNDQRKMKRVLKKNCRRIGVPDVKIDKAYQYAMENQRNTSFGIKDIGYRYKVFLAGHPYNIYDSFANLNLLQKLHNLDIGVVTEESVCRNEKLKAMAGLIKRPYWLFFIHNFAPAISLMQRKEIDGIVYVSSFCCGTDSITIEMIKNRAAGFPVLVLKLDEQTGEAGYNTRLEAFREVL